MAQQQSITLDTAFSGAPLVPQEEEQEQVTPVSVPQQAPVADSVDTQVNQAMPAPTPPQPVVEAPVDFDEFTGFQESIEKPRPLPILFGTYAERRNTVTATDDAGRKAELKRIQQDVFDQYRRGVLTTGEKTRDSERENLITNSKYVGIPQLDENGGIVNDANGVPVLIERYALPAYGIEDEQQKFMGNTIGMFELANQPNGVYLFYADESNIPTNGISLKAEIDKARTQVQEYAVERGFARTETMEGGMSFYDDILKKRGVTRPEKRLYYLRNQAASTSIFTGAEMTRTGVMFKDMVPGLFNFGMMLGETAQDHALSIPMTMMSMLMPDDVKKQAGIEDSFSFFNAPGFGFGAKGAGVDAMIEAQKKIIRGGRTLPMFTLTAEQWAKENGVSVSEAEAVMGYTSDIATAIARFTLETLVTAPTVLKGVRHLDNRTYREFSDYVLTNYKTMLDDAVEETTVVKDIGRKEAQEQGAWKGTNATPAETADLVTIQKVLDDANISFTDAFEEFAESRLFGSRAWLEGSIERALQTRTVEMGAERVVLYGDRVEKVLQPKINSLNERIAQAKVDIRKAPDKATRDTAKQKIARLKGQRKGLLAEKRELEADILVPSHVKNFLVDDLAIATPIAGATYATLYAATEGNELAPGIGAMVSVVASLNPTVRRGFSYTGQSIKYAAHSALKKAGIAKTAPPDAKAVELARRIKGANPELRDRIYAFMEDVSAAVDKYGSITYPKGHPMAGKPILTEDVLYQSFSMMSGLSSLRALQEQTFNRTADIKEIGKFKQEMETLQNDFDERARMVDQLGQVVQNLKYLESSVDFDTASDAANIVRTMRGFYEIEFQQLTRDQADFNASLAGDAEIEKIFSADATALDVQEWLGGGKSIAVALATEMRRFQKYGIDPNLSPVEAEQALQAHLNTIQTNVAEALKRHEKIEFSGSRKLATQDFNNFITVQEEIAYVEASNKFDKLKTMFPPTARVDLTDIHDQIVLGELELDLDIVDAIVPALREGTEASRSFVPGLNIDKNVQYALRRLFGDSAEEYMDAVGELRLKDPDADALIGEILEKYDLQDKSPYAQMMGIRQGFLDADIEDALPRLGVSVDQLVHIVSGLGRRVSKKDPQAARSLNQLRMGILDRSRDEFYEDFYTGRQQKVEGLGDEYQAAREFYRTRYIDPFRNEDTSIRQIVKMSEGKRDLDDKSLDKFLANFQLNERRSTAALNQMQQQLANVIGLRNEDGSVKALDVSTPEGQQVRSIITQLVIQELSNTLGGKKFREILTASAKDKTVSPEDLPKNIQEFVEGVRTGDIKPESGINLGNFLDRDADGQYRLRDVNGEPLVNIQEIDYMLSFDNLKRFSDDAKQAEKQFFDELADAKKEWEATFKVESGTIRRQLQLRSQLVESLGQTDGYLGNAILKKYGTEAGPEDLANLREDFVRDQIAKGVDEADARADFRQVVQQSVIDALFDQVTRPGDKTTFQVVSDGQTITETKRMVEIDPSKLLDLLGVRGDTTQSTKREKMLRELLGDPVYEHLEFVADTLYVSDSAVKKMNITGLARPLSAESQLSRLTSYFRGVISLRWLISEAAIREARRANSELTKVLLFNPKVGRQVLDMVLSDDFKAERFAEVYPTLISNIAKNDVMQEGAYALAGQREEEYKQVRDALESKQRNPVDTQAEELGLGGA